MFGQLFSWFKAAEKSLDKSMGKDISTPDARRRAKWHFMMVDHGILRILWHNLFEISPGVWRSNQPDGKRIAKFKSMGIRTVLNLRGKTDRSPYLFEKEACEKHGLNLISHKLSARKVVGPKALLALLDTFETIEKPFVMHCKSGADRAGLGAALYLLHIEGAPIDIAKQQLSFKYLHIKSSSTGILDDLLDAYEVDTKKTPMDIREWIATRYDPDVIAAGRNARKLGDK